MKERIISLGKALVGELDLEESVDTLGRWMAHYIAQQMKIAKKATGKKKIKAEQRCFETILKLWRHRSFLPDGHRPFESFESIFKVIERLDPEKKQPFYFSVRNDKSAKSKPSDDDKESVDYWLNIAENIDKVVRIWLDYIFEQAALCATSEDTLEWLNNSINFEEVNDISTIVNLLPDDVLNNEDIPTDEVQHKKIELIKSRISKLETFNELNQSLLDIFKQELGEISNE